MVAPPAPLRRLLLLALLVLGIGVPQVASAQYFGRNKVQYRTFDFKILKTEHFDVYYYDDERAAAGHAARMAERWYERLSRALDHQLSGRQPLILYASHPEFEQTNAIEGELDESTGGVTEISKRRIVLPLAATLAETDHVIGHELVHAFQFDMMRRGPGIGSNGIQLPLWLVEGMAEYLSIGPIDPNTAMWMRDAVDRNKLPKISQLGDPRWFPYRYGHALWAYLSGRFGDKAVGAIFKAATVTGPDMALRSVTGIGPDTLSLEWHAELRRWYQPVAAVASAPESFGRAIETERRGIGRFNVGPALSPDGTRLVFFSERDLFSIEAFLADASTGRIIRRITRTATDPHYQSLQFIQSAGAWSPDGRQFAFAGVSHGSPVLTVIDIESGRTLRELEFKNLGEIFSPTWSPDGQRIAFSALVGGVTDLFVVELGSRSLKRLTSDVFADLMPAWSPDGRSIAFVTDRFGTKLDDLDYGDERLALLDPDGGTIRPLPCFDDAKNINPQWSADGKSLYFVSDHGGVANLYRLEIASGTSAQVTDLRTGVSGITRISPAVSVARNAARLVFTSYVRDHYAIYMVDSPEVMAGHSPDPLPAGPTAAALPPVERRDSELLTLVRQPQLGLRYAENVRIAPYRAALSLDHISQTSIGVGSGSNGIAVGGGTTLFWSDMLGNHQLATLVQFGNYGGSFTDGFAGIVAYENRKSRWNWGLSAGQVPSLDRTFVIDEVTVGGSPAIRQRDFRYWQIDREVGGSVEYPFNRVQRIELGAGFRNVSFKSEVETQIFDEFTGGLLADDVATTDTIPSLNFATTTAAFVYDNSIFGGTSPILGQRMRLEASPVFGDLDFIGALADVRRYQPLLRPLVLAGRVLHFGRYGRGGEDERLGALFIGYPWLVRGYELESFSNEEFASSPVLDRMLGSRIAVANLELRLPLLGPAGLVRSTYVPPVELAGFYDAGVAWVENDRASFLGGDRDPVTSHGLALRVNLLGFAVAEVDFVHPNDRPEKGWYWAFSLQPGF